MQENHIEQLDKMFPDGWAIAYTQPNGNIRFSFYNPHKADVIYKLWNFCLEEFDDNEEDGKR